MARTKQTARKPPAKKKSGADKRRSPRLKQLAAKEPEDYDDEPAPEAEDTDYRQTAKQTRSDNTLERQDDRANVAAEATLGGSWDHLLKDRVRMGGAVSLLCGKKRGSSSRKYDAAFPCDPFSASGYPPGWNYLVDDHPAYVEKKYRDAGFDWDDAESRAKIDALAVVCQKLDLCMPVPGNKYMLKQWVEWLLEQGVKATPARGALFRDSAKTVIGLATDAHLTMSAIAAEQGPPGFCESCAMAAATLLDNHDEIDEITFRGLVVTRDGSGGYVIDNTNLNQKLVPDHLALCCSEPRCWLCNHCNVHIHTQADEFDDEEFVEIYKREHANINNNHVW